jgi:hypothetical protein
MAVPLFKLFCHTSFTLLACIGFSLAQDSPLFIQGGLEGATATDDSYNTGGSISVNGFNIEIPKNVQVQFPAAWVPWKDFVADIDSMLGYEVNVGSQLIRCASLREAKHTSSRS